MAINLGDVVFGLRADTSSLREALSNFKSFSDDVTRINNSRLKSHQEMAAGLRRQEEQLADALVKVRNATSKMTIAGAPQALINQLSGAYQKLSERIGKVAVDTLDHSRALLKFESATAGIDRAFRKFQDTTSQVSSATKEHVGVVNRQTESFARATEKVENFNQKLRLAGAPPEMLKQTETSLKSLQVAFESGPKTATSYRDAMRSFGADMGVLNREFRDFQASQPKSSGGVKDTTSAVERLATALENAHQRVLNLQRSMQAAGAPDASVSAAQGAFDKLQLTPSAKGFRDFRSEVAQLDRDFKNWKDTIASTVGVTDRETDAMQHALRVMEQMDRQAQKLANDAARVGAPTNIAANLGAALVSAQGRIVSGGSASPIVQQTDAVNDFKRAHDTARASLRAFTDSTREHISVSGASAAALEKQANSLQTWTNKVQALLQRIKLSGLDSKSTSPLTGDLSKGFADFQAKMSGGALSGGAFGGAQRDMSSSFAEISRRLATMKSDFDPAMTKMQKFAQYANEMARATSLVTGPLAGAAYRLTVIAELLKEGTLLHAAFAAGLIATAYGAIRFAESLVHTELGLIKIRQQLTALTGSLPLALEEMRGLLEMSNKSGTAFDEVSEHFARIETAARGSRIEGDKVRDMFKDVIMYAGNMGLTQQQLTMVLSNTERALTKGNFQWREYRQELSREFPNAATAATMAMKQFGVSNEEEFDRMLRRGQVTPDQFFPGFFKALLQLQHIDPNKAVENLGASFNRLKNVHLEFNDVVNQTIGVTAGLMRTLDQITAVVKYFADAIGSSSKQVFALVIGVPAAIVALVQLYGVMRGLSLIFSAAALTMGGWIGILVKLTLGLGTALTAFNVFNQEVEKNKTSINGAKLSLEEYLDVLEKTKQGPSGELRSKIGEEQESQNTRVRRLDSLTKQIEDQQTAVENLVSARDALYQKENDLTDQKEANEKGSEGFFARLRKGNDLLKELATTSQGISQYEKWVRDSMARLAKLKADRDKALEGVTQGATLIKRGGEKLAELDENKPGRDLAETETQKRMRLGASELARFASETNRQFFAMQLGPEKLAKELENIQLEKTIEGWRDKLEREGFTLTEVNKAVAALEGGLRRLKDAELANKLFVSPLMVARDAVQDLGKSITDNLVSAFEKSTSVADAFKNSVVSMISFVIKKIAELAILNPILNTLFGGNGTQPYPTFGVPGTATGGLLGSLLPATVGGVAKGAAGSLTSSEEAGKAALDAAHMHATSTTSMSVTNTQLAAAANSLQIAAASLEGAATSLTSSGAIGAAGRVSLPGLGGVGNIPIYNEGELSPFDTGVLTNHAGSGSRSFTFASPSLFRFAPRLHEGLQPDEFPAILQNGETVTPRRLRGGGGASSNDNRQHQMNVTFQGPLGDKDLLQGMRQAAMSVVSESNRSRDRNILARQANANMMTAP